MAGRLDDGDTELSEINVTPFIDVILVLLIVFMVAAPLSTVDLAVNLPGSSAPPSERPQEPLWLTFTADRTLVLNETQLDLASLAEALDARTQGDRNTTVFLRADSSIDYGALMGVLDGLRRAGYLKVSLVGLETSQ